ncbi:MAG: hypothetical protein JNG85_15465 [Spirochaetaceae bacterium]|nr:hypothetical protein [Spirochaetaceae bacterium]
MAPSLPPAASFDYAAFYCEENVLRLLSSPALAGRRAWALLVSNPGRSVAMRAQRAGRPPEGLVSWDYHVLAVALLEGPEGEAAYALDLDSLLAFPVRLADYLAGSFAAAADPAGRPLFRLVPAARYAAELASDRSHMRAPDGSWLVPPPSWEAPGGGRPSNLLDWIDMGKPSPGAVLDPAGLRAFAARPEAGDS